MVCQSLRVPSSLPLAYSSPSAILLIIVDPDHETLTWTEPHTVNWAKVTLEVLNLDAGGVVELVQLQVLSPTHEDLLVEEQGGGVGGAGDAHLLDLVQGVRPEEDDLVPRG